MEPILKFLIFSSLFIASTRAIFRGEDHKVAENRFHYLSQRKQNVARIRFYLHEILAEPNATVWEVARSRITSSSPSRFGTVLVIDDLLTPEPDRNSERWGRGQGLITFADLNVPAVSMYLNIVFNAGAYNGSSFIMLGRNPITTINRELPIVGGTGIFRMARGYCITNTYSFDRAKNYAIIEYTAYISQG